MTPKDYAFYQAQLFTYLRLTGIKLGLLINFGKKDIRLGISRVINDQASSELFETSRLPSMNLS